MKKADVRIPAETPARLAQFITLMTGLVEEHAGDEAALLKKAGPALKHLMSRDDWLDDSFAVPDPDIYRQYLIYCDPLSRFSIVSFVWEPGQQTPIHDHMVWGLVGVLRGSEQNETFTITDSGPVSTGSQIAETGSVAIVSPTLGDVHRVSNVSAATAISIHVYGADIGTVKRHVFQPDGTVKEFISAYSNPTPLGFQGKS